MVCNINIEKLKDFMSTLSLREEEDDAPMEIGGYEVHLVTFNIDAKSFSGANGKWEEVINVLFKSNKDLKKIIK